MTPDRLAMCSNFSNTTNGEDISPGLRNIEPELLCDIVGNSEAVSRLSSIAKVGNLPNIILSRPPGMTFQ